MRQSIVRAGLGMFIFSAVFGNYSLLAAQGTSKPATPSSPSQTPSSSEQGKADRKAAMHQLNEACGEDMKKFCRHVQPGSGHIMQCLELQQSQLSPKCNEWFIKAESQGKFQKD
jgi:hypothetical protein